MGVVQRIRSGWNAFLGRDPTNEIKNDDGNQYYGYSERIDRLRLRVTNQKSIIAAAYNRIAMDVAQVQFEHSYVDQNGSFIEPVDSGLQNCLTVEANTDETHAEFLQDLVLTMFDNGSVAAVPTDTDYDPTTLSERFDILRLRVARIVKIYPSEVVVHIYNERKGVMEYKRLPKSMVAIIENPFYEVMNRTNSTLQRLLRTINALDKYNEETAQGKLDLLIKLPYVIKSEQRKKEAEQRRKDIEEQLTGSRLGIAYIDGTEQATQLSRPLENTLWQQIKDLTNDLYNQLGLTEPILDGTANEAVMINYYNNTIAPICSAICNEFKRKFLSKTARSQGQSIVFFRDPFKLVPVSQIAQIASIFRTNEIMTSNEIRAELGLRPLDLEEAEQLRNPNLNVSDAEIAEREEAMTGDALYDLENEEGDGNEYYDENEEGDILDEPIRNI